LRTLGGLWFPSVSQCALCASVVKMSLKTHHRDTEHFTETQSEA